MRSSCRTPTFVTRMSPSRPLEAVGVTGRRAGTATFPGGGEGDACEMMLEQAERAAPLMLTFGLGAAAIL